MNERVNPVDEIEHKYSDIPRECVIAHEGYSEFNRPEWEAVGLQLDEDDYDFFSKDIDNLSHELPSQRRLQKYQQLLKVPVDESSGVTHCSLQSHEYRDSDVMEGEDLGV